VAKVEFQGLRLLMSEGVAKLDPMLNTGHNFQNQA